MTFLQPWAAWFLAGLPVIVALYFLRLKRRSLSVSTHLFWQRVLGENSRRAFFQRLRQWLSLLLHVLIFSILVAALARPLLRQAVHSGASTVIVLDVRARMQAVEPDGRQRLDKALDHARALVRQAGESRQFALITLDAAPAVAVPFSTDQKPLLDALDAIRPTDTAGELPAALRLADSLLKSRGGDGQIVLLSDRTPDDPALIAPAIATPRDNLAITRFATRPLPADPATSAALIELQNFGTTPARTELELTLDGRTLDVKPFALQPGERRLEILPGLTRPTRAAQGWLTARITADDALASDNIAYATLPPARLNRVLLITAGNSFLEKLLAVDPSVKFQLIAPEAWQPALAEKFEAVIFDSTLPAGFDFAQAEGNFLFLKRTPFSTTRQLDHPLVTGIDPAHPATRGVSLQNVSIVRATALTPPASGGWLSASPLRSFDDALLITGTRGTRRFAALGFDLLESDLPLRVAFPLLISNTLHWLAGDTASALPAAQAGEIIPLTGSQRAASEPLTSAPSGPLPAPADARFLQPMKNGFYAVSENGGTRWIAVNTFSAAESDLRVPATSVRASAPSIFATGPLPPWQWLTLVAFALFTFEWWLFHRRKTE